MLSFDLVFMQFRFMLSLKKQNIKNIIENMFDPFERIVFNYFITLISIM